MKRITMKGKSVDEAVEAALQVLGASKENAKVRVLSAGRAGMLGMIGGEQAEVEVIIKESVLDDAKQVLQEILDKMQFLAMVEAKMEGERVLLNIKGEDLGRIIGKEGASLHAFEILVSSMLSRIYDEPVRVDVDAADYREKRKAAIERLAKDVVDEVISTGQEKDMRSLDARDRRIVHMFLKDNPSVKTESVGQGRDRRLIISPK